MTLQFLVFCALAMYLVLKKPHYLSKSLRHPVFLSGFGLLVIGMFLEAAHGSEGYPEIGRIAFMLGGAILIATVCRDKKAVMSCLYGVLLASIWLSILLLFTSYGAINSVKTHDFKEASRLRYNVLKGNSLDENLNRISRWAAQGGIVAFTLAVVTKSPSKQFLFLGIGGISLLGTFLPMSRGGILILVLSCAAVLYKLGIMKPKVIIAVGLLTLCALVFVPDAVFKRFVVSDEVQTNLHGRDRIYTAVIEHLPEYVWTGVGITNFYGEWGRQTLFFNADRLFVTGAHNCFAQVTIFWGLPGLLATILIIWYAFRCLPTSYDGDVTKLCVLGLSVAVILETMLIHQLYAKDFSLVLGLLVGGKTWIWPRAYLPPTFKKVGPARLDLNPSKRNSEATSVNYFSCIGYT